MPSFNPSDFPQVAGKCFLVTGASSGIGRETALLLAELGATVILNGRNEARLEETRTRMKGEGHLVAPADLCATSCLPWLKELLNTMRKSLAGVAHCAGTHAFSPLRAYRAEALEETLRGQAVVMANLFHAVSRLKAREVSCSLVAMSSISAHFGIVGNGLYGASRAHPNRCAVLLPLNSHSSTSAATWYVVVLWKEAAWPMVGGRCSVRMQNNR